jgi:hypothetical protein
MEDQTEGSGLQDVVNRDSVMMLFNHSPNALDSVTLLNEQSASPTPEQLTQQHQDQQAQQHALLKYFFKGNYCAPLNKLDLGSVLDGTLTQCDRSVDLVFCLVRCSISHSSFPCFLLYT